MADNAELVVSEFVANATNLSFRQINELALPVVHLRLFTALSRLRIEVCGCETAASWRGKVVWAELARAAARARSVGFG